VAKPVVDGIEQDLAGRAQVLRLNVADPVGLQIAQRYGVRSLPTLVILDGKGQVYKQIVGVPGRREVVELVRTLP